MTWLVLASVPQVIARLKGEVWEAIPGRIVVGARAANNGKGEVTGDGRSLRMTPMDTNVGERRVSERRGLSAEGAEISGKGAEVEN